MRRSFRAHMSSHRYRTTTPRSDRHYVAALAAPRMSPSRWVIDALTFWNSLMVSPYPGESSAGKMPEHGNSIISLHATLTARRLTRLFGFDKLKTLVPKMSNALRIDAYCEMLANARLRVWLQAINPASSRSCCRTRLDVLFSQPSFLYSIYK